MTADHDVPDTTCPACGTPFNGAANVDESTEAPKPGDLSVCIRCGELLVFGDTANMRILTAAAYRALPSAIRVKLCAARTAIIERAARS